MLLLVACSTVPPAPPPPTGFEPGQRLAGTLPADGVKTWHLEPREDTYFYLQFDPRSALAELSLLRKDVVVESVHTEAGSPYDYRLALIIPGGVPSLLRLSTPEGGEWELRIIEVRQVAPGDRERAAALLEMHRVFQGLRPDRTASEYRAMLADLEVLEPRVRRWAPDVYPHLLVEKTNLHIHVDDFENAAIPAMEAIELLEAIAEASGRDLAALATAYAAMARVRFHQGKLQRASHFLTLAIDIYKRWDDPGSRYGQALFLSHRGKVYESMDLYDEAEQDQKQALEICQEIAQKRMEATTRMHLATLYQATGRIPQAFEQLETVRPLVAELRVGTKIHFHATLGHYYLVTGQLGEARELLETGLRLAREVGDAGFEALILTRLGELNRAMGAISESRQYLQDAARLADRHGLLDARIRANLELARLYLDEERWDEARPPLETAVTAARESGSPASLVASSLELARLSAGLGDFGTARRLGEEAADSAASLSPVLETHSLARLAEIELAADRPETARQHLEQALHRVPQEDLLQKARVLALLGVAAKGAGELQAAEGFLDRGLSLYEGIRGRIRDPSARTDYLARWHSFYGELIDVLIALDRAQPGRSHIHVALGVSERAKARTLAEILTDARIRVRNQVDPELVEREIRIGDHLALLRDGLHDYDIAHDSARAEVLRSSMADATQSYAAVERQLRQDFERYATLRYPDPLKYDQIRPLLPDETYLLHYAVGERASYLFVVTAGGVTAHPLPPAAELAAEVEEILETAQASDPRSRYRFTTLAQDLWQILLNPALDTPHAADSATAPPTRLWIVADGPLHRLPFELLRDGAGRHAVERFEIGYAPSATVLANLDEWARPHHRLNFFALASSEGQEGPSIDLQALPGTLEEIRTIATLFPETSMTFSGADAHEDNLFGNAALAVARWVHIASHAVIDDEEPARSAILLAPDANGDRRLEMAEIFDLRLSAEAVVLSACETGLGQEVAGEGMIGLSRAFFYAGSRNLVVSLWPVPDRSTALFMRRFYEHLSGGLGPAAALARAKRDFIAQGWSIRAWAPFIVIGGHTADHDFTVQTADPGAASPIGEGG